MLRELKIKKSFQNVKKAMGQMRFDTYNHIRYLQYFSKEQSIRIRELERRLAQVERLNIREKIVR